MGYPVEAGHAGRTAFSSMAEIANHTFDGFERLARLNLQTMKTTLAEQHGIALEVVDERSFDWLLTLPVAQAQAGLKKTLAYWQRVNAIAVGEQCRGRLGGLHRMHALVERRARGRRTDTRGQTARAVLSGREPAGFDRLRLGGNAKDRR